MVRFFRYGVAEDGTYNNRGDLRQIASRLAGAGLDEKDLLTSSVDRLSQDSVAKGGLPQVTLVAHPLSGIISRYYLSRRTPDQFGTVYQGNVRRLITIGSPIGGGFAAPDQTRAERFVGLALHSSAGASRALPGAARQRGGAVGSDV